MNGQIITFYSYKGGTGRTMALANVATLLSEKNRVLVIDWDLEAPGLHYFFKNKGINNVVEKPGLIDLFQEFQKILEQHLDWRSDQCEKDLFDSINFDEYLYTITENKLLLFAAGKLNEDYPQQVALFQWQTLFYRAPWLFRSFAKYLANQYDYVLIDSRTGLNDISGICTALMPDKLIAIFTPSFQSIKGIISAIKNALHYRKESDDLRPLNIFPLPSRLELQEKVLFDDWRFGSIDGEIEGYQPLFEELLSKSYGLKNCDLKNYFDNIQIQQFTYYAYGEKIAVSDDTQGAGRLSLSTSYSLFTEIITNSIAPWTVQDIQPKLLSKNEELPDAKVSIGRKRRLDVIRVKLRSQRPSDIFGALLEVRKILQENAEDQEVYEVLLDAVRDNPGLRQEARNLLEEMIQKGSKSADSALRVLPTGIKDLMNDADDAYYSADYNGAIELYRQILAKDPPNVRAREQLAKAELNRIAEMPDTELPRAAIQHFRRARSHIAARDFVAATTLLNAALEESRVRGIDFPEAERLINSIQDLWTADEYKSKADLALKNEQWASAWDLYNKALLLNPHDQVTKELIDGLDNLMRADALLDSLSDQKDKEREKKLERIDAFLKTAEEIKTLVSTSLLKNSRKRYFDQLSKRSWRLFG